jgi:hypothetical protein
MTDRPLLIAGATGYGAWPANTPGRRAACLQAPIDGIEIDVQITVGRPCGRPPRLPFRRPTRPGWTAPGWTRPGAPIKAMTLHELRRYDVGRTRPGSEAAARYPAKIEIDGAYGSRPCRSCLRR